MKENRYKLWQDLYLTAKNNMRISKNNNGVLIEVAAQHPLTDGEKPNEEFEKRLVEAIQLFKEKTEEGKRVFIYVPGSIHMANGHADKISLSEAGKRFLIDKGISPDCIFADEMNRKYKGDMGVYNSTDECYVASQIFREMKLAELHSVCSSAQMMRKVLSYIRFGYVPYMHAVSCDEMYHNYIDEVFKFIPKLLEDDNVLQGESEDAIRIRKARKPE